MYFKDLQKVSKNVIVESKNIDLMFLDLEEDRSNLKSELFLQKKDSKEGLPCIVLKRQLLESKSNFMVDFVGDFDSDFNSFGSHDLNRLLGVIDEVFYSVRDGEHG